jgi:glutathione S-transferase
MPSSLPRLITIPFSHYCEKARWALDHVNVDYVEEPHLPGLHIRHARRAGGRTMVPVLVTAGRTLIDSADILAWCDEQASADRRLYPAEAGARAEVTRLEALCNGPLGKSARLVAYHHALPHPRVLADFARPGLTALQAFFLPFAVPLVKPRIRRMYEVSAENAARALETTRDAFKELGAALGSRQWLVGDRMTAADITFAALSAPLIGPEGHPANRLKIEAVTPELASIVRELRATPAGQHALRLYRSHRGTRGIRRA